MIYTIITGDTHCRNINIIQIVYKSQESIYKVHQIEMCLDSFLKASKGNNRISKSMAFHSVGTAYINDRSKNELAHILLIGGNT